MDWTRTCAALIPCHNEARAIQGVIEGARHHLPTVLVVNDGSTDATAEIAARAGARVLSLPGNSGKGAALRRGWEEARNLGFLWAMMLDGDGQHDPHEIPRFLDQAEWTGAELVVGNRMPHPGNMPALRRWANRWMSRSLSRLTGVDLPDSQCGFRLARVETLLNFSLYGNRFEVESSMLVAFLRAGNQVRFVPIRSIYAHEQTKINTLADTVRWAKWRLAQRGALRACSTMRVP